MTSSSSARATLSGRVTRSFHRLFAQLTRKATVAVTVVILPFIRVAVAYKAELCQPANDNHPRHGPKRTA